MEKERVIIQDHFNISYEEEVMLQKEFWIHKLGYYPTKIEKVARITTFEEENKESEKLHSEFVEFIKQRLNRK